MKLKNFTQAAMAIGFLFFVSCNQEETTLETIEQSTEDLFAKNWQEADLSEFFTGEEMNYPIATQLLQNVLNHKDVYQIRFVPGILNNKLQVKVVSIDAKGTVLAEEFIKQTESLVISEQLNKLRETCFNKEAIIDPTVAKHILQFNEAADYVNSWKQKSSTDINEVTSFNGMRVRHFSIEPQAVSHMVDLGAEFINLSWGINPENKLTTVFVPVFDGAIQAKSGESGSAFDFTRPCPTFCNPD